MEEIDNNVNAALAQIRSLVAKPYSKWLIWWYTLAIIFMGSTAGYIPYNRTRGTTQLEIFLGSHLNHSLGRDSKSCQAIQIKQPITEELVPLYVTTRAPHLSIAIILFKEQEQIPFIMWQEGICTVPKLGQQGIDKHDQGTAQQGAPASHTHHPTGTRLIFPFYTIFSKMGCPLDLHGRIIYLLHSSLAFFSPPNKAWIISIPLVGTMSPL